VAPPPLDILPLYAADLTDASASGSATPTVPKPSASPRTYLDRLPVARRR
jgi:hypothetical protein